MTVTFPTVDVKAEFERCVLQGWHEAHGADAGRISSSWGDDRVIVMIEDALFKGECLLTQSKRGNEVLEQYVHELLEYVAATQAQTLSDLLQRKIESTSISVNTAERWVIFIFRLVE